MSGSADLERRYARLMAFYPKAFRREHEQEILSVLMAGAAEDQRRPGLAESVDLLRGGSLMRLRNVRIPSAWECRHLRFWIWVRVLSAIWLIILTGVLCQNGYWWGLALLAPVALHFYIAYRLGQAVGNERGTGRPPSRPPSAAGG